MDIKTILGGAYTPEIEKSINEAVGKEFIPKDKFDERGERLKQAEKDLKARDEQLAELTPKAAGNEALLAEITRLQGENKTKAEEQRKQFRDKLLDIKLNEHKPISLKALKAELDLSKVSWDDNDNISGLDEQIKALKESETLKGLFQQTPPPITPGTGTPQNAPISTVAPEQPRKIY